MQQYRWKTALQRHPAEFYSYIRDWRTCLVQRRGVEDGTFDETTFCERNNVYTPLDMKTDLSDATIGLSRTTGFINSQFITKPRRNAYNNSWGVYFNMRRHTAR